MKASTINRQARFLVAPGALLLVLLMAGALVADYASLGNLQNIGSQAAILALLALGQMLVMLVRGFDISVGAVAACSSTVAALTMDWLGTPSITLAVVVGLLFGGLNGLLIAYLRVQPIVATLCSMIAAQGLARLISDDGQPVVPIDASALTDLAFQNVAGIPLLLAPALICMLLVGLTLKKFTLGRHLFMVGCDPQAASLVGVDSRRVTCIAYLACGALAGLAGAVLFCKTGTGLPTEGVSWALQSVAAAVIGGTALQGGTASVWPVFFGVLLIQALETALNIEGVSPFIAEIVMGLIILVAGGLDRLILRLFSSSTAYGES
ncbi:ABC transporter permease [Pseudomonas sp. Irchel s3b2]|uniref:ABC transporter permease n=1 Tax=Pseudomonas sp. Irchel s3b2 TaxID=2009073 RepID=UPI000BA3A0D6|nr:ABC transporter permease [Pseudomonas sp. Irchel s3b2]